MASILTESWMSQLSDDKKLSEITIPGTHNSCAKNCNFIAKCQNKTIADQLRLGVRFLDIRCRHIDDRFDLHHGIAYLGLDFDSIQTSCLEFLSSNPSETVAMIISTEFKAKGNKCNFEEIFIKYANKYPGLWYMNERVPTLKEARGKIVLLRRFASQYLPLGIDMSGWRNSKTFHMKNHSDFEFNIQDEYKKQTGQKWNTIIQHVERSMADSNKHAWYLNYCSAHKLPMVPMIIAKDINKKLLAHFKDIAEGTEPANLKFGTIILDFADENIIRQILSLNFGSFV